MCDILRTFLSPFMLLYLVEAKFDDLLHMPYTYSKMNRNISEPLPLIVNVLRVVQGLTLLEDYGIEKRSIRKLLGLARDV